jgi:uroporphyrinogen-III synthase
MMGLAGKTVAILEARRSAELATLLAHEGASVYVAPMLREAPAPASGDVLRFVDELCAGAFALVLLLTGVGTRALVAAAEAAGRREELLAALARLPLFCRGPKPIAALRSVQLVPTYTTPAPYTSEQILAVARGLDLRGTRVGLVLHGGPAPELSAGLGALGARVRAVRVYQWALPADVRPIRGLRERLEAGTIDAIAFTNAAQVENLVAIAAHSGEAEALLRLLRQVVPIVAVGPVCAAALRAYGLPVHVEPAEPKMGPMVRALVRFVQEETPAGRVFFPYA